MEKLVIALCGYPRSGKDTIAAHLVTAHGFTRVSFADPIYQTALGIDPFVLIDGHFNRLSAFVRKLGWDECKKSDDVRQLLQRIGTEGGRDIHGFDCWINIAKRKIEQHDRVVITDMRFENELSLMHSFSAMIWRVRKPGIGKVNEHASEQMDYASICDDTIDNDSSIDMLNSNIDLKMLRLYQAA